MNPNTRRDLRKQMQITSGTPNSRKVYIAIISDAYSRRLFLHIFAYLRNDSSYNTHQYSEWYKKGNLYDNFHFAFAGYSSCLADVVDGARGKFGGSVVDGNGGSGRTNGVQNTGYELAFL